MARDLFNRYLWLVDTIRRYGRISRAELDECWRRSPFSQGEALPRRTFYNYRQAVEELFNVEIKCDSKTYEYYIDDSDTHNEGMTDWLMNTAAVNDVLSNSREIADRIFIEDVPSARHHLAPAIDAIKECHPMRFDYLPYYRTRPTLGVVIEPYFLKIFRQRWYVTGRNVEENRVKTYALDRISSLNILPEVFEPDPSFDAEEYVRYLFGIVSSKGEPRRIALRTDSRQAKYFRALPLHHTQEEAVHDAYSIFYYKMKITDDLVSELLSYGARIEVLEPPELRARLFSDLTEALKHYM